jgi:hypothetical protein
MGVTYIGGQQMSLYYPLSSILQGIFLCILLSLSASEIFVATSLGKAQSTTIYQSSYSASKLSFVTETSRNIKESKVFKRLNDSAVDLDMLRRRSTTRDSSLRWDQQNYGLHNSDHWQTLLPPNWNRLRLGNSNTRTELAMYSQLQCLNTIRVAIITLSDPTLMANATQSTWSNAESCFGQVRQAVLCSADITLEPTFRKYPKVSEDWYAISTTGIGEYHRCYDWAAVHRLTETFEDV